MSRLPYVKPMKGGRYLYYYRNRKTWGKLPNLPENHPEFLRAYVEAERRFQSREGFVSVRTPREGTVAAVCVSYMRSDAFLDLRSSTRENRRRIVEKIRAKGETALIRDLLPKHIRADLEGLGPEAANNRLKVWRAICKHAIGRDWIEANPASGITKRRGAGDGFHCWTDDEIAQFRRHHASGTKPRLAMELALWTAARRSDLVLLGRQHMSRGSLTYTSQKTGVTCCIPVLPEAQREIDQLPKGQMLFLETQGGHPHSVKAFGMWFKRHCKAAGLPDRCTIHGLRKARARIMAEEGRTAHSIMAWGGWKTLSEVSHYTEAVNRRRLTHEERKAE